MRRLLVPVLVFVASLGSTSAVSADPPEHIWTPPGEALEFAPGEVCDFGVRLENAGRDVKTTVFPPAADGSEEVMIRGGFVGIATNLATDDSIEARGGAAIRITTYADGSSTAEYVGSAIWTWYFEGAPSDLEPGLYDIDGRLVETYAPDGSLVSAEFSGRAVDLCAELGG